MKSEFYLNNDKVTIDFTKKYCNSFETILDSYGFRNLIEEYLKKSKNRNNSIINNKKPQFRGFLLFIIK